MKHNYALYYPTIEFQNYDWLYSASLIWDRIYRIVPESYTPHDPSNIRELVESGEIGIYLSPDRYAKLIADEFNDKLSSGDWFASALSGMSDDYRRIHKSKVDVTLHDMIIAAGGKSIDKEWFFVPTDFESQYMTYLANKMAEMNQLHLISDSSAAWACSTFYDYDGQINDYPRDEDYQYQLATLMVREFLPINYTKINTYELLEFREKRKLERQNFVNSFNSYANSISKCNDPKIVQDMIHDMSIDIDRAINEYKGTIRDLKYDALTGVFSITVPVATEVINKITNVNNQSISLLSGAGVGIGVITSIKNYVRAKRNVDKSNAYSYLLHMRKNWDAPYYKEGYPYYLSRVIEEFIND